MDIIAFTIVCLEVQVDMTKIESSFTTDTALNDVLVHGFVCHKLT